MPELPGLGLENRPELFKALIALPFQGAGEYVRVRVAGESAWILTDGPIARGLLQSQHATKSRPAMSRKVVGGYIADEPEVFRQRRSRVSTALTIASRDRNRLDQSFNYAFRALPAAVGDRTPFEPDLLADLIGLATLVDLVGSPKHVAADRLLGALRAAMVEMWSVAEHPVASAGRHENRPDLNALHRTIAETASNSATDFVASLRSAGWGNDEVATEALSLVFAGWGSVAAAVTSARTLQIGAGADRDVLREVLRLYPPSWLMARRSTALIPEIPAAIGDLLVVCQWHIHRQEKAWPRPLLFDAHRFVACTPSDWFMPFGSGIRRCPAEAYAYAQIESTLRAAPMTDHAARSEIRLVAGRSAAFCVRNEFP